MADMRIKEINDQLVAGFNASRANLVLDENGAADVFELATTAANENRLIVQALSDLLEHLANK
jgi:hypothetical protein